MAEKLGDSSSEVTLILPHVFCTIVHIYQALQLSQAARYNIDRHPSCAAKRSSHSLLPSIAMICPIAGPGHP